METLRNTIWANVPEQDQSLIVDGLDNKPIHMEIETEDGTRSLNTSMKAWYEANLDDEEPPIPDIGFEGEGRWSYSELWYCLDAMLKGAFDRVHRFQITSLDTSTDVVQIGLKEVM
jgi:hypothetical protein